MPPASDLRRDAAANRTALLEAATRLLAERPQATVAEIAEAAGIGRATAYRRFPTRADLMRATVERLAVEVDELTGRALAGDAAPLDAIARLAAEATALGARYRFLAAHQAELTAELDELTTRGEARLLAWLERARRRGQLRTDVPAAWALVMVRGLSEAANEAVAAGTLDAADAARLAADSVRAALAP